MTASPFTITPTPPTSLKLTQGQEGRFSFTVQSLAAPDKTHDVMLQALMTGADGQASEAEWLIAGPQRSMTMAGGKTETVTITARPTIKVPPGAHSIKLAIAVADRPNDEYVYSQPVACEVVAPVKETAPRKPFPRWLILVIVGGLVVLVGGGLLIWKIAGKGDDGAGMREACGDGKACARGLLCAVSKVCLLAGGAECEQDALCASGECEDRNAICTIPIGDACDPGERDLVPCPTNAVCDPASKKCMGNVGARCATDDQCATEKCKDNLCAVKTPPIKAGEPCVDACPDPMQCSATTHVCVEQMGRPCIDNKQCASGLCEANICAQPTLGRNCTADGAACGPDMKCMPVQAGLNVCRWPPGHSCEANADCSSTICNEDKICTRDDGKCESGRDCRTGFVCLGQRCLKRNGAPCQADQECESTYCSPAGCAPSPCPPCPQFWYCNNNAQSPACVRGFIIHDRLRDGVLLQRR